MATNNAINGVTGSMITKYTASNTWSKNVNTQSVEVIVWNSGAGGGSGRQATTTTSGGGAGGNAGGMATWFGSARLLGSSETVTVASGGAGGLTQASATSNGNAGSAGGTSSFGNIAMSQITLTAPGGVATTATATTPSASTFWQIAGYSAQLAPDPAGNGKNTAGLSASGQYGATIGSVDINSVFGQQMPGSGGGGGGADSVVIRSGGVGGNIYLPTGHIVSSTVTPITIVYAGGTAGIEGGTINGGAGANATNTSGGIYYGGAGGGGGGGQSAGGSAGTGGAGGTPGGGGGGGGGSLNGTTSGAGGAGARGEVWVIEYF